MLQWRNAKLDFASLGALQVSLALTPNHEALTRAPVAEDLRVLEHVARDADVRELAHGAKAVERLWEACQVPDYRKLSPAAHAELVTTLYGFLMQKGRIPDAWFAAQVDQANRTDGDIDTLSGRIAQIRTWTFVANRPDWLYDPDHWQGITRELENKLSDALHERLTERFVDRRTSVLMRRLRENSVLNTEIGKTGEVIVEGHVIGRLDGFTFAPDAAEAGSDAKALQAAAQQVLAREIDARAEKLGAAPDEQFVLTSDGTIRWTGDAVAKLVAADDALHPRLRIISDERLTGASREAVQTRLDLWLKTHIEKLLGPLFELSKAEDLQGIARGIAFQLVEALGVLERSKIAAEMKDLDQPSRAALRKYGVRFGAYHIYFPQLLKPAARSLASLLWAEKQSNVDMAALSNVQHLASSGRTSFPVDKQLARDAYRVLGYRQCGERAVRVDILERLADLIRPALAWRETSPGEKPAGAFDGRGFVVTQAMTSLTGSAGEDFASILRALGYRMDRRPPLPPKPVEATPAETSEAVAGTFVAVAGTTETVAAETPPVEATSDAAVDAPVGATAEVVADAPEAATDQPVSGDPAPSAALLPDVGFAEVVPSEATPVVVETKPEPEAEVAAAPAAVAEEPTAEAPAAEAASEPAPAAEATAETPSETATEAAAETAGAEAAPAEAASATAETPAEPQLVEVWRPGGRSDERRPHHRGHDRNRGRHQGKPAEGAQAAEGGGEGDSKPAHHRDFGKGGRDKREGGPSHRPYASSAPRERDRPIDPNSPFAKLAALKEQLAGRKE